jgi:hypothetical protein
MEGSGGKVLLSPLRKPRDLVSVSGDVALVSSLGTLEISTVDAL